MTLMDITKGDIWETKNMKNKVKTVSLKRISDTPPKLHEAQAMVGGLIEILYVGDDRQLLFHEEALLHANPIQNLEASELAGQPIFGEALLLSGKARWD